MWVTWTIYTNARTTLTGVCPKIRWWSRFRLAWIRGFSAWSRWLYNFPRWGGNFLAVVNVTSRRKDYYGKLEVRTSLQAASTRSLKRKGHWSSPRERIWPAVTRAGWLEIVTISLIYSRSRNKGLETTWCSDGHFYLILKWHSRVTLLMMTTKLQAWPYIMKAAIGMRPRSWRFKSWLMVLVAEHPEMLTGMANLSSTHEHPPLPKTPQQHHLDAVSVL